MLLIWFDLRLYIVQGVLNLDYFVLYSFLVFTEMCVIQNYVCCVVLWKIFLGGLLFKEQIFIISDSLRICFILFLCILQNGINCAYFVIFSLTVSSTILAGFMGMDFYFWVIYHWQSVACLILNISAKDVGIPPLFTYRIWYSSLCRREIGRWGMGHLKVVFPINH